MDAPEVQCMLCAGAGVVPQTKNTTVRAELMDKQQVQNELSRMTRQANSWREAYEQSEVQAAEHLARAIASEEAMAKLIPGLQWLSRATIEGEGIEWEGAPAMVFTDESVAELMQGINAVVKAGPKEVLG